jgi:hypothetical protein
MADGPAQAVATQRTNPINPIRSDLIDIYIEPLHYFLQKKRIEVPKILY